MRCIRWFWAPIVALACLSGCASSKYEASAPSAAPTSYGYGNQFSMDSGPMLAAPAPRAESVSEKVTVAGSSGGDEMYAAPSGGQGNAAPAAPPPPPPPPPAPPAAPGQSRPATPTNSKEAQGPAEPAPAGESQVAAARRQMLIYTAALKVMVDEVAASLARVEAITRDLGGFLARRDDASITIRVPAERFDEALARVTAMGEVLQRKVTVDDVTEEFLDLEIRLKNLRAVRARLEKLLERATKVEDAVLLERELARVAGEMERIQGRMKLLRDQAAFSTITVSFQQRQREAVSRATTRLPVGWLDQLGLGRLLSL